MKKNEIGYPRTVVQKAWQIMDARREKSVQDSLNRRAEIHRRIPEIREIELEMQYTGASIARSVAVSPEQAEGLIQSLSEKNLALQEQRKRLLLENNFPADYLKEKYSCSDCEDTGYVATQMCHCFSELLRQQAFLELSSVSGGEECTFDNFDLRFYSDKAIPGSNIVPRERMEDVFRFCREYARDFSMDADSLLMLGRTGLGKTHLSLAIAWEVTDRGFGVVYTPVQQLIDKLEVNKFSYEAEQKERYTQDIQAVTTCDLLVLDDLGTEMTTSFTLSALYNIVNTRLVEQRPTIINTNLEPQQLEKVYSQRMISRLMFGYKPLRFFGEDIRYLKRRAGR